MLEAKAICSACESVAHVQEAAAPAQFGIECPTVSDVSSSPSEMESDEDTAGLDSSVQSETSVVFCRDEMLGVLKAKKLELA